MGSDTQAAAREVVEGIVIRFAGDSGDGMQVTGSQFTQETALFGNDLATFPDYPAEIRAPAGTTFGVSAFQIHFGSRIETSGDQPDVLVAMNPAALKVNIADLKIGGLVIIDEGTFTERNFAKAGITENPLENSSLAPYQTITLDISKRTLEAVEHMGLSQKEALRCKNFWTLGLMLWMYGRERSATVKWLNRKFAKRPEIAEANIAALNAGHIYGETAEMSREITGYTVAKADLEPGTYRTVTGTEALAWGLLAGAKAAELKIFLGSYPITPASPLLHSLANLRAFGVTTYQAEDEIAAVCSAIGASYAGSLGITSSSGPGIALKTEAIGLAIITELPLIVVDTQRAGPSTGLPTKTEQSDFYLAAYGRNGDAPMPVIAASTPTDCFEVAFEAVRLATKYMTPVMLMSEGYLANAAEPWRIPDVGNFPKFPVKFRTDPEGYLPFARDKKTLARDWVVPGTPKMEHRIGGLEKDSLTGNVSYDPENHQKMTNLRAEKVANIANDIPDQEMSVGEETGDLVIIGWGSTYGPISEAVRQARSEGHKVSHIHIRYLIPLPKNLGALLGGFETVMVAEMNAGQLVTHIRSTYAIDAKQLNKVTGKPFKVAEISDAIHAHLEAGK